MSQMFIPPLQTSGLFVYTPIGLSVKRVEKTPGGNVKVEYEPKPRPWRYAHALFTYLGKEDRGLEEAWRKKLADKRIFAFAFSPEDSPMASIHRDEEVIRGRLRRCDLVVYNELAKDDPDFATWRRLASEEGVPFLSEEEALRQ